MYIPDHLKLVTAAAEAENSVAEPEPQSAPAFSFAALGGDSDSESEESSESEEEAPRQTPKQKAAEAARQRQQKQKQQQKAQQKKQSKKAKKPQEEWVPDEALLSARSAPAGASREVELDILCPDARHLDPQVKTETGRAPLHFGHRVQPVGLTGGRGGAGRAPPDLWCRRGARSPA